VNEVSKSKNGVVKILVVDDNAAALYATSRVLRSAGYEVHEASTGSAALAGAKNADLIVLDVNLPDMDGFEVCRRLRDVPETAHLPVLHLSATFTQTADFSLGLEAGADSYLTRPVEAPVLLATVRTLLFARNADYIRRGLDAKLRTIFKLAPVALAMTDKHLRYESVNPAFCELTGYSADELVGLPVATVFGGAAKPFDLQAAADAQGDSAHPERLSFKRKDGTLAHAELRLASEELSGARIIVVTDIAGRLQAESDRENMLLRERAARTEAERGNRQKEEFLATLSHELRNPLSAILGWATLLGRMEDLPKPALRAVEAIERNSRLQSQMIADLLDYAGVTFGKMRLSPTTVDPYTIVREALDVISGSALSRHIEIKASFDDQHIAIEGDSARLQQVILNLLSNAIKFSPDGGIVEVSASRVDNHFRLVVADHGQGISAEFLPHIFERFSQQDASSTKRFGGLGLGLAIVKQIVELHAGSVEVASAGEGRGATFGIRIPLSENAALPAEGDSQRLRALDLSGVVVLVVEDDKDARELTKRILTDAGARVIEAHNVESALSAVTDAGANFLISDIGMADVDGYHLIRTLRSQGLGADRLPAIALTAFARLQDRLDALAAGFQDHLVKPVDPSTLILRIASLRSDRRRAPQRSAPPRSAGA
jgi:PAS domain S-box-containing protein